MSDDFNAKMKLLIKSEKAMLSLEMRKKSRQTVWIALALLAVLVGLITLNATVFLYLETMYYLLYDSLTTDHRCRNGSYRRDT
jgi:hypothetical protein